MEFNGTFSADNLNLLAMRTKFIQIFCLQLFDVISLISKFSFFYRCFHKSAPVSCKLPLMNLLFLMIDEVMHKKSLPFFFQEQKSNRKSRKEPPCFKALFSAFISAQSSEIFNQDIKLSFVWATAIKSVNKFSYQVRKRYCFPSLSIISNCALKVKNTKKFNFPSLLITYLFIYFSAKPFPEISLNSSAILSKASRISGRGEGVQIR